MVVAAFETDKGRAAARVTLHPDIVSRMALAAGFAGKITLYPPAASAVPLKMSGIGR